MFADATTLMAESKEELKSLLMRMKEESGKTGFKLNIPQPGGPAKGLRTPRELYFEGQWDLITELPQDWGNTLGVHKTLCTPGPRRKEQ